MKRDKGKEFIVLVKKKRTCSAIMVLVLLMTMIPVTVHADAAPQLNLYVVGKDGKSVLFTDGEDNKAVDPDAEFAWKETWYFQQGTEDNHWLDSAFTANQDGSGKKLSVVQNFEQYPGFEDTGALVYSGFRYRGGFPCIAVCKRGILLEDLIDYVEEGSGIQELRGDAAIYLQDPTRWNLPMSTDPSADGKYNRFIWNGSVNRYYYPGAYENAKGWNVSSVKDYIKNDNKVKVPAVFSMVGYYHNNAGSTVENCLASADTYNSLRLFLGTSTVEGDPLDDTSDIANNMGNYSAKNVQDIFFYPVYYPVNVPGGVPDGTEGENGYKILSDRVELTTSDNWFRASEGEIVTLRAVSVDGSPASVSIRTADGRDVESTKVDENTVRFKMPAEAVTVEAADCGQSGGEESLSSLKVYEQAFGGELPEEKKVFSAEDMISMDESGDFYYGGFDSSPAVVQGKADLAVSLQTLLEQADVEFKKGDQIIFTSDDGQEKSFSYTDLYGNGRYYFPALYTGSDWSSRSNGKMVCEPHLVINGAEIVCDGEADLESAVMTEDNAYYLTFGMTMDDFSLNSDASPSADASAAAGYLKHVASITVRQSCHSDVTWYAEQPEASVYTLTTEEQLRGLEELVGGTARTPDGKAVEAENFAGRTIQLGADVVISGKWKPVGTEANPFAGIFDGKGNTIYGIKPLSEEDPYGGLFAFVTGTVRNLTVQETPGEEPGTEPAVIPLPEDSDLSSPVWDGKTVDVSWYIGREKKTVYVIDSAAKLAGAAALTNGLVNPDCLVFTGEGAVPAETWNNSKYVLNGSGTHGGCNRATDDYSYGVESFNGKTLLLSCDLDMSAGVYMPPGGQYLMEDENTATKISASFSGTFDGMGHSIIIQCDRHCTLNYGDGESIGLIGRLGVHDQDPAESRPTNPAVRNVAVYGSVSGNRSIGGIVGKIGRCSGFGTDEANEKGAVIENCANFASVKGTDAKGTGGIAGAAWNGGVIKNCYNAGEVVNTHNSYGGIAGSCEILIQNCYNRGMVSGIGTSAAIATENGGGQYENTCWLNISADMGVYDKGKDALQERSCLTSAEMKDGEFVKNLGEAFTDDTEMINAGYPILFWQKKAVEVMCADYAPGSYLLKYTPEIPLTNGAVPAYDGKPMYVAPAEEGDPLSYLYLISVPVNPEEASGKISIMEGAAETVARPGADTPSECAGDLNGNKTVNVVDAQIAYDLACGRYPVSDSLSAETIDVLHWLMADVNQNDLADASDARAIQYFIHYSSFDLPDAG